jgi:aspartokinase/homoserine dehydrogenase 1
MALIGPGRVGRTLLDRIRAQAPENWTLALVMNSRQTWTPPSGCSAIRIRDAAALTASSAANLHAIPERLFRYAGLGAVVIDATADHRVAQHHAEWLEQGIHVVSANKLALADATDHWCRLKSALSRAHYGASATVGAGLPILDALTRLREAGEALTGLRAVLSGSLGVLCQKISAGTQPARGLLEVHEAGLTEPDPRMDLSGQDVARKLLILARTAGLPLDPGRIDVQSLVPDHLVELSLEEFLARIHELDDPILRQLASVSGRGTRLVHLAELRPDGSARVGLSWVDAEDSLARLSGVENRIEISTTSYAEHPMVIAGPGAGIEVTALALWSDLKRISESVTPGH